MNAHSPTLPRHRRLSQQQHEATTQSFLTNVTITTWGGLGGERQALTMEIARANVIGECPHLSVLSVAY